MFKESFTFDDFLIQPSAYSRVKSRSLVDTSVDLGGVSLKIPAISSSMSLFDTKQYSNPVEPYLLFAISIAESGGMHIFSRAIPFEERIDSVVKLRDSNLNVGISVGVSEFFAMQSKLEALGVVVSIDIANGAILEDIVWRGSAPLIVGNFANPSISTTTRFSGNIIIKLGIGSGAGCQTREKTGVGSPQAGLIYETVMNSNFPVISDGGVKSVSDFCKAIALGADAVMMGSMFAHVEETPWHISIKRNGEKYKPYRGMASSEEKKSKKFVEGASGYIKYEGKKTRQVIYDLHDGLSSSMSYCDAFTIREFQQNASFISSASHHLESSVRLLI